MGATTFGGRGCGWGCGRRVGTGGETRTGATRCPGAQSVYATVLGQFSLVLGESSTSVLSVVCVQGRAPWDVAVRSADKPRFVPRFRWTWELFASE